VLDDPTFPEDEELLLLPSYSYPMDVSNLLFLLISIVFLLAAKWVDSFPPLDILNIVKELFYSYPVLLS